MISRRKLLTMIQLALYDKHSAQADLGVSDYFRHDYIYRKNLGTRISVGIGAVVILVFYWFRNVYIEEVPILELNIQQHIIEAVLFILAVMAVYTVIGTIQGTREYYLVEKRLKRYAKLVRFLERTDEHPGGARARRPRPTRRQVPGVSGVRGVRPRPSRLAPPARRPARAPQSTAKRPNMYPPVRTGPDSGK